MTTDKYQPTTTILIQALYESILNDKDVEEFTDMLRSMEAHLKAADELVRRLEVRTSLSLPIGREILDALTEYRAAGK